MYSSISVLWCFTSNRLVFKGNNEEWKSISKNSLVFMEFLALKVSTVVEPHTMAKWWREQQQTSKRSGTPT
jgi:hypothetical protein